MVFFCKNAQCHLFCRFHYASKKKTSARPRAQMFSRSNYTLNDPLKATERAQSSASSRPELLIHHLRGSSEHQETSGRRNEKQKKCWRIFSVVFWMESGLWHILRGKCNKFNFIVYVSIYRPNITQAYFDIWFYFITVILSFMLFAAAEVHRKTSVKPIMRICTVQWQENYEIGI